MTRQSENSGSIEEPGERSEMMRLPGLIKSGLSTWLRKVGPREE